MGKDINNKLLIQLWKEFLVQNNFSSVEDALEEFLKCCSETINSNIEISADSISQENFSYQIGEYVYLRVPKKDIVKLSR